MQFLSGLTRLSKLYFSENNLVLPVAKSFRSLKKIRQLVLGSLFGGVLSLQRTYVMNVAIQALTIRSCVEIIITFDKLVELTLSKFHKYEAGCGIGD